DREQVAALPCRRALLAGAAAALEHALDELELRPAAESLRGGLRELREGPDRLSRRALAVLVEVDELRVEPVPHRAPLVLVDERHRLRLQRARAGVALRERRRESLDERGQRG